MSDELKPCPFCGCTVTRQFQPFERRGYVIDCNRCNGGFHEVNKEGAIERWNNRPSSNEALLREALEPFAACVDQIKPDEDDEEWAKFRLLIKDYRRAARALARIDAVLNTVDELGTREPE